MKTSYVVIAGMPREVRKEVATDPSKASKAGRFAVVLPKFSVDLQTINERDLDTGEFNYLRTVYLDGQLDNFQHWPEVRENAARCRGVFIQAS